MTKIEFYFNVLDKFDKIAELTEAAHKKGHRVTILTAHEEGAHEVTQALWARNPSSFIPNSFAHAPAASETPILIDWRAEQAYQDDILISLRAEQPPFFSRYLKLVELVGLEEADKAEARKRFRFYRDCGYSISHQDMKA